jgi:hypothetical protein
MRAAWIVLAMASGGCSVILGEPGLEGRPCKNGECKAGYHCQADLCVPGDAPHDGGIDAGATDGGSDAGAPDGSTDAGFDAGSDAGTPGDAGPPTLQGGFGVLAPTGTAGTATLDGDLVTGEQVCVSGSCLSGGLVP